MSTLRSALALATIAGALALASPAHAVEQIKCDDAKGVRFDAFTYETSSEFTITCRDVPSGSTHSEPPWVTFVGSFGNRWVFRVKANPQVYPRYGNIDIRPLTIVSPYRRPVVQGGALTITDSAEYRFNLAPDSLATAFGGRMGNTHTVTTLPLPTELDGTRVVLTGGPAGVERNLELLYTSNTQVNFHVPVDIPVSDAPTYYLGVVNTNGDTNVSVKEVAIHRLAPALFHAGFDPASGITSPSMYILRIDADGTRTIEYPALDEHGVQKPIAVNVPGQTVFFVLYGTGMRGAQAALSDAAFLTIPPTVLPIQFIGSAPGFVGLDQINIEIPSSLAGSGLTQLLLQVEGYETAPVTINFQ